MRIDYREPRQSSAATASSRQRSADDRPSSLLIPLLVVSVLMFAVGFGVGWHFSQKSAKKAFRAAMEQQSLESAPKEAKKPQEPAAPAAPPLPAAQQTAPTSAPQTAPQAAPAGQVPLSFFESLPKGQKQAVLGSGINEKPKPAAQQPAAAPAAAAQPAAPAAQSAVKPAASGFVVQVASFSSLKEAEATKARLAAKGYSATVVETNLNDKGTWYRVRIGRHLDKQAAADIAERVGGGAKILPDMD